MERKQVPPTAEEWILQYTESYHMPIAKTEALGHGEDARGLSIGTDLEFSFDGHSGLSYESMLLGPKESRCR